MHQPKHPALRSNSQPIAEHDHGLACAWHACDWQTARQGFTKMKIGMAKTFAGIALHVLALTAFGFAAANDAHAEVAIGCRKPEAVPALQQQVLKDEGMVPVIARFVADRDENGKETGWRQETIMMNPKTKIGLNWMKTNTGGVCIFTRYLEMELFNFASFDQNSLIKRPGAKETELQINRIVITNADKNGENPMFRAKAYTPTNAARNDFTDVYEVMSANPKTSSGTILYADLNGSWIKNGTRKIPSPQEAPVKFGAMYSETGKSIISQQTAP